MFFSRVLVSACPLVFRLSFAVLLLPSVVYFVVCFSSILYFFLSVVREDVFARCFPSCADFVSSLLLSAGFSGRTFFVRSIWVVCVRCCLAVWAIVGRRRPGVSACACAV